MKLSTLTALILLGLNSMAANYNVSSNKSHLDFDIYKFKILNIIHGKFDNFSGSASIDANTISNLKAEVDVNSIDTGIKKRNNHLKTADFLDSANYPKILIEQIATVDYQVNKPVIVPATITMRGVTKNIDLEMTVKKLNKRKMGILFSAKLNRYDFGVNMNHPIGSSKKVFFDITKEMIHEFVIDSQVAIRGDMQLNKK